VYRSSLASENNTKITANQSPKTTVLLYLSMKSAPPKLSHWKYYCGNEKKAINTRKMAEFSPLDLEI